MSLKKPLELLHIDDSSILRKTVSRGLEPFSDYYVLSQVGSVDEALALINSGKKFDVILTDWLMAGKSGLNLLCTLKAHPAYHNLPVFFLTSEYDSSSLLTAVTYGAAGILKKPITGPEIHAYLQKRASFIAEASMAKEDSFVDEAKVVLAEIEQVLPLKNPADLSVCLQHAQSLKMKATSSKWPLLAEYSQKIDDIVQATIKKEIGQFAPLTAVVREYISFIGQALTDIESGRPHLPLNEHIENNLKNYHTNLEAGVFANGVFIPWDVVTELQEHLTPEGRQILQPYLVIGSTLVCKPVDH